MPGRRESLCEKWFLSKTTDAASILIYLAYMKDPETNLRVLAKTLTSPSLIFWPLLMTKPVPMTVTWSEENFFKVLQKVCNRKKTILRYTILWNANNAKIESLTSFNTADVAMTCEEGIDLFIYTIFMILHTLTSTPLPNRVSLTFSPPSSSFATLW